MTILTIVVESVDLADGEMFNVTNTNLIVKGAVNLGNGTISLGEESTMSCEEFIGGPDGSLELNGNLVVLGDFTSNGCSFNITKNGELKVVGNIVLDERAITAIELASGGTALMTAGGKLTVAGSLIMRIIQELFPDLLARKRDARDVIGTVTQAPASSAGTTKEFPIATFGASDGNFERVNVTLTASQCVERVSPDTISYGATTASLVVTVRVNDNKAGCGVASTSGGLSTGAIVGIAVGCAVAAIVITTVVVVCLRRKELAKKEDLFRDQIAAKATRDAQSMAASSRASRAE